jgi:plastin-1
MRAVNKQQNMNVYQIKENLNLAINAAKGIGCKIPGITSSAFIEKKHHLILALIWQLMRLVVTQSIDLQNTPELLKLCAEGEELADLMKLAPEKILVRWVNYHLAKEGLEKRIANLGGDLKDCTAYLHLLHSLDNSCVLQDVLAGEPMERAERVVRSSIDIVRAPELLAAKDLVEGNSKLNMVFLANLFNTKHGLEELNEEEKALVESAANDYDDIEGSRDERAFRLWINSLGIEDVHISDLYDDARDGLLLLKVIHRIDDTVVDWRKVEKNPNNKFKMGINCTEAVNACKKLKLVTTGIGGTDILDKNRKNILALVWQLVRCHYLRIIGSQTEKDLVAWAVALVSEMGISSLKDKALGDGRFLIHLCDKVQPGVVNWEFVTEGATEEDRMNNAKYAISIARKMGAIIFCVWEDIEAVNYKMILVLVCSLYDIHQGGGAQAE